VCNSRGRRRSGGGSALGGGTRAQPVAPPRDGRVLLSLVPTATPDAVYGMQRLVCPRVVMALPEEPSRKTALFFADCSSDESEVDVERDEHDADDEDAMDLSRRGLSDDEDACPEAAASPPSSTAPTNSGRLAFSVENILDPTKFTGRALCWKPLGHPDDDLSGSDLG
jgi:hypothetical protein